MTRIQHDLPGDGPAYRTTAPPPQSNLVLVVNRADRFSIGGTRIHDRDMETNKTTND